MVNLIANRRVVPELIQHEMTGARLAAAALPLLEDQALASEMRAELAGVRQLLTGEGDPLARAAGVIADSISRVKTPIGQDA